MTSINTTYKFYESVESSLMKTSALFRSSSELVDAVIECSNLPIFSSSENTRITHPILCVARITASSSVEWRRVQTLQSSNSIFFQRRKSVDTVRGGLPNQVVSLFHDLVPLLADETGLTRHTIAYKAAVNLGNGNGKRPPKREFVFTATTLRDMQTYISGPVQYTGYVDNNNFKLDLVVMPPTFCRFLPKGGKEHMSLMFGEGLVWNKILTHCQVFGSSVLEELERRGFLYRRSLHVGFKLSREGKDRSKFDSFFGLEIKKKKRSAKIEQPLTPNQIEEAEEEKISESFFIRETETDYIRREGGTKAMSAGGLEKKGLWRTLLRSGKKKVTSLMLGNKEDTNRGSSGSGCNNQDECGPQVLRGEVPNVPEQNAIPALQDQESPRYDDILAIEGLAPPPSYIHN